MKLLSFLLMLVFVSPGWAALTPLELTPETISLWKFDEESGNAVDSAPNPLNGTLFSVIHEPVPGLGVEFGSSYKFTVESSFIDLGPVIGSKIDFTGAPEFSIEAVIQLSATAPGTHTVFNAENVRLTIINNQLAGMIRQPGGLYGLVSDTRLQQGTSYRVGLHYSNKLLVLTINGLIDSKVLLDNGVSAPQFTGSRAYIGGDIFKSFFPGYIDDVRVTNVLGLDISEPEISLVEPGSFQVKEPKPQFLITLSDIGTGINPDSIQVLLNGVLQTGITRDAQEIRGTMDDDMQPGILNEVIVRASDYQGNTTEKKYFFSYNSIAARGEYEVDEFTLALWHMNDFTPSEMKDSSPNARHGQGNTSALSIGDGVFSKGKIITQVSDAPMSFDGIRFQDKFTFEGWFQPSQDSSQEELLFYNGQVSIFRVNGGFIRTYFHTTGGTLSFSSSSRVLPVGELHHLAVSWDGSAKTANLKIYADGVISGVIDAVSNCDFDPIPKIGKIGSYYTGMIDEVRLSSNLRTSFNIPTLDNQVITYLSLKDATSVSTAFPELHAVMNSSQTISISTVKVRLNDVLQPLGTSLIVTETSIDGTFSDPARNGFNTVDIEFYDSLGNFRKKSQYFFRIQKLGASHYDVTPKTAAYWNFDVPGNLLKDSSANGYDLSASGAMEVDGYIGSALRSSMSTGSVIGMNCRSYTVEGHYRLGSSQSWGGALFSLNGSNINQSLSVDGASGNLNLSVNSNYTYFNRVIPGAFPKDGAFHHVALVYDGSRRFSQMLVLVDGEVKGVFDVHNSCDVPGGLSFTAGSTEISSDEIRISKEAIYAFNLMKDGTDRPEITSINYTDGSSVNMNPMVLNFTVEDQTGINVQKSSLQVNGVSYPLDLLKKRLSEKSKARNFFARVPTNFSAEFPLDLGSNTVQLILVDFDGNSLIKKMSYIHFRSLPPASYDVDQETLFLYHLDEVSGNYQDATGNVADLTSGWTNGSEGVFNTGVLANGGYTPLSVPGLSNLKSYTFEAWVKRPVTQTGELYLLSIYGNNNFGITADNKLKFYDAYGYIHQAQIPATYLDGEYHHYALISDPSNTRKNIFLLIDGNVIGSFLVADGLQALNGQIYMGYGLQSGTLIDEVRMSKVPRYELVSTKE